MNFFKKVFGIKSSKSKATVRNYEVASVKGPEGLLDDIKKEVIASDIIKESMHDRAIAHLSGDIDLVKNGTVLTLAEKKERGINSRIKITHEIIELIKDEKLDKNNPGIQVKKILLNANAKNSRADFLKRTKSIGIKKVKISCVADERSCSWCKKKSDKLFSITEDFESVISENCQCEPYRICLTAK